MTLRGKLQLNVLHLRGITLDVFCIDLDSRNPEILQFGGEALKRDMEFFNVKSPLELETFDRRIFETQDAAKKWLKKYRQAENSLKKFKKRAKYVPCLLYKRRYLIQTLMGEKLQTIRHYKKPWGIGQIFYLYDQTHFVPVKLLDLLYNKEEREFLYLFNLV